MFALFALAAAVGWGSSDFAAGYASRKSSATAVVILTHLASVTALLCFAVRFSPRGLALNGAPTSFDIAWGLAAGVAGGAGAMLLFSGLGKGSMAVVAPITATGAAAIPVLFGIVTGDAVSVLGIGGIVLALIAIVLVSVTGGDDATPGGDDAGAMAQPPLVVPDDWAAEFELPAPTGAATTPPPSARVLTVPPPPPSIGAPLAPPAVEMTHSEVPAPPAPRFGVVDGELRMPIRTVRQAILALVAIAVLSAAAIASQPIGQLLDRSELTGTITAQLVFALVIVGLAAFALNNVKPLFDFSELGRRREPIATPAGPPTALSWRDIMRQPGVRDALFSGVGFGLFFVFIARASEAAGYWPLVSARAVSVVMFALIALATTTSLLPERGSRLPVVLAGALDAAAAIFFVMSTRVGLLSVGAVLAALYPVVTVVLARVITKERIRGRQMAGLGLALCAVGLLAM